MKRLLILLAVPVALVAGCSAGSTPAAQPTTAAATTPAAPSTGTGGAATTEPTTEPTATSSHTATPAAGTGRCHSQDLTVKTGGGDGAAGSFSVNLVFTNKSAQKCTLTGYPGVSWVTGDNGTQVNAAFGRAGLGAGPKQTITLAPGGVAHAMLVQGHPENFPVAKCKPVKVRGYRVYPPDETASIFVSSPQSVCSAQNVGVGTVYRMDKGPGDSA
jgi:uncharacterized protein DUF4232